MGAIVAVVACIFYVRESHNREEGAHYLAAILEQRSFEEAPSLEAYFDVGVSARSHEAIDPFATAPIDMIQYRRYFGESDIYDLYADGTLHFRIRVWRPAVAQSMTGHQAAPSPKRIVDIEIVQPEPSAASNN